MIKQYLLRPIIGLLLLALSSNVIAAQGLIRDAEIEKTLRIIAQPLVQAAGIGRVNFFIVNSNTPNAFVLGGNNIFIHSGLVRRLKSVEMLQAVIAHEIGHITGGHISQRAIAGGNLKTATGVGVLLGVLAGIADPRAGIGVATALNSASQKKFLSFSRGQESSADQSGVRYMARAGINPSAALDVLNLFRGQEVLNISRQDAYASTHPLSSQRLSDLKTFVAAYPATKTKQTNTIHYWYARARAKFDGFIGSPKSTLRKLKKSDKGEIATLTRAIAYHRLPNKNKALTEIKRLISMRPNDPYYLELYGQMQLENGNAAGAVAAYSSASQRLPKDPQILAGLGRAQLAVGSSASVKRSLNTLKSAYSRDPRDGRMLRDLGQAYAKTGNPGMASVVTAERYALASNFKQAEIHAKRAVRLLPEGTVGWRKAADILSISERLNSKRKR